MLHLPSMSNRRKQVYATLRTGKVLGLDVGSKYIGIALGVAKTKIAIPFDVCIWNGKEEVLLPYLKNIFQQELIEKIIIGHVPDQQNIRVNSAIESVQDVLVSITDTPIVFVDEHITTQEAENRLSFSDIDLRVIKNMRKDAIAAQIILERYFSTL